MVSCRLGASAHAVSLFPPKTNRRNYATAQILSGKRVFVSNATGESMVPAGSGELTYNQFYASMKDWGRYELAPVPADGDLIFEIHYEAGSGWVSVYNGEGGSAQIPQIRLIILDPKTRTVLWAFTETVQAVGKTEVA
jgi:hypothetical protein